jgi:hypothetical protein
MTIHVTNCSTGQPLELAAIADIYENAVYTDSFGNYQVPSGQDGNLYGTVVTIAGSGFLTSEFTITSYDVNDFCLNPVPGTVSGTGPGSIY